ncbi:MAG: acyl-CoA/acyl-ACP dehydrogenase [Candidatus Lambdaproteobacteria bacterium]|nr:acyl-CoA/acyl-ACP dehydrogenase [Candidatus Lambdaproteobacteria bacterium]
MALCESIRALCARFPGRYWRELDEREAYPEEFLAALTESGYMAALIPEQYGGMGLAVSDAALILEEIARSGANASSCHAQMYTMGTVLRHGSDAQKQAYLPAIAEGRLRLLSMAVTEPDAGSETTRISTRAVREGDRYVVNGRKVFISRVAQSDLLLLLVRTTPYDECRKKTEGLSILLVDLREAKGHGLEFRRIPLMFNHHTNEVVLENLEVPVENRIGPEGQGLRCIFSTLNAERILLSSQCIGDGRYFIEQAARYAGQRVVFGRPIGMNQGIQFPLARAYAALEGARLMRDRAAELFDRGGTPGREANLAKLLSSEAAWQAANACLDTFGGYGFAREYDVERKFREARLKLVTPVSNNLVLSFLGEQVLGLPRSF